METIDSTWRPAKKSSDALLKAGYSQDQLNTIGKVFIERNFNKLVDKPSTKFSKMVRDSGPGHNVKPKKDNALADVMERKSHKSDSGEEKAKEVKEGSNKMTKQQAIAWYNGNR